MFKRRYKWFGDVISDEGFSLSFQHRSATYHDENGCFQFAFEDGYLFPKTLSAVGPKTSLSETELAEMVDRVCRGIQFLGVPVEIFSHDEKELLLSMRHRGSYE